MCPILFHVSIFYQLLEDCIRWRRTQNKETSPKHHLDGEGDEDKAGAIRSKLLLDSLSLGSYSGGVTGSGRVRKYLIGRVALGLQDKKKRSSIQTCTKTNKDYGARSMVFWLVWSAATAYFATKHTNRTKNHMSHRTFRGRISA